MEFIDDDWDAQPRTRLLHPRAAASAAVPNPSTQPPSSSRVPHAAACAASAALLLAAAYYLPAPFQPLSSLLLWVASSLLLAPFAPSDLTGGDVSVGRGPLLPAQEPPQEPAPDPALAAGRRARRHNPTPTPAKPSDPAIQPLPPRQQPQAAVSDGGDREEDVDVDVGEWTDQEMDILRRQMVKHPAGEPQRWEKIAEAFGGRRTPESVIRAAKTGGGGGAASGGSFDQFLRKRKPLDPRAEAADADGNAGGGGEGGDGSWSAGDDRALLNALKEFPKDTAMRWEKVAAAVPGKTKAACMKRVTELKRDFRSSKAA